MIQRFEQPIYPRVLWTACPEDYEKVLKRFVDRDGNQFGEASFAHRNLISAQVIDTETDDIGFLVWYSGREPLSINGICHEASHCTIWWCADLGIGVSEDDSEAFAYLSGFIGECIDKGCKVEKDGGREQ